MDATIEREVIIRQLRRERPRRHFLRTSGIVFGLLVLHAWTVGGVMTLDGLSPRRLTNLQRFLGELRPHPLQERSWDWGVAVTWATALATRAAPAAATTLAISIVAITLAGLGGAVLGFAGARTLVSPEPYAPEARAPSAAVRASWTAWLWIVRALLIFFRAIPEYVWAFIALAVVGANVWAAVAALAIHNAGILGKLTAEVIENLEPQRFSALRALGATRLQIVLVAIRPSILPRVLLLFFYRWESCLREATVLGMLGIVSLGFYVQDARARQYYDVMLAMILTGSLLVMIGDVVSAGARGRVRRAR
jgi:phosphonate transport system permease protein